MTAEDTRQVWGSKLQFLLTCIGYAVGLGNLWKFPSEAYNNGGGAFLFPYIICSIFIGLPCLYLELFLGQFTRSGASRAFRHYGPVFQGLGWMSTAMSAMVGIYYNVVVAVCLIYLKDVVVGRRDRWITCTWEWNTPNCVQPNNKSAGNDSVLAPDEYYTYGLWPCRRALWFAVTGCGPAAARCGLQLRAVALPPSAVVCSYGCGPAAAALWFAVTGCGPAAAALWFAVTGCGPAAAALWFAVTGCGPAAAALWFAVTGCGPAAAALWFAVTGCGPAAAALWFAVTGCGPAAARCGLQLRAVALPPSAVVCSYGCGPAAAALWFAVTGCGPAAAALWFAVTGCGPAAAALWFAVTGCGPAAAALWFAVTGCGPAAAALWFAVTGCGPAAAALWFAAAITHCANIVFFRRNVFEYQRTLINWQLLAVLFIVWLLTAICLVKGVKWIGRIAYVTATVPYILIGALFINCISMEGALLGIKYFLTPKFSMILESKTWIAAAKQMCLSISVGYGGILSLASYNERSHNCFKDAVIIVFADSFMSIFGGCVVFSTLGYLKVQTGKEIATLAKSKNGLAFSVYPEALETMFLGNVWGFLLFFMFFLLGISSQFGSTQTLVTSIVDQFPNLKTGPVAVVICSISFLLGIAMCTGSGFDIQNLMSDRVGGSVVLLSCLLEILILIHYYGVFNFMHDLRCCLGVGRTKVAQIFGYTGHFFAFLWTIVTPILLAILVGFSVESSIFPKKANGEPEEKGAKYVAGLIIEYIPLLLLPFFFVYNIYVFSQKKECWKEAFKVQKEHPSYERIRLGGKIFPTA